MNEYAKLEMLKYLVDVFKQVKDTDDLSSVFEKDHSGQLVLHTGMFCHSDGAYMFNEEDSGS